MTPSEPPRCHLRAAWAAWLLGLLLVTPAWAQVVRDGSLGAGGPGLVPGGVDDLGQPATYLITEDLGARSGTNLLHSFEQFDVGLGETATFTANNSFNTGTGGRGQGGDIEIRASRLSLEGKRPEPEESSSWSFRIPRFQERWSSRHLRWFSLG